MSCYSCGTSGKHQTWCVENKQPINIPVIPMDATLPDVVIGTLDAINAYEGFITKDSGQREQFESGMVRDTSAGKIRYDLVYMPMLKRWAELMTRGAQKYGDNNWKQASGQSELNRFKESAFRHFMAWFLEQETDEDHGAAVFFNISGVEFVKEKLRESKN